MHTRNHNVSKHAFSPSDRLVTYFPTIHGNFAVESTQIHFICCGHTHCTHCVSFHERIVFFALPCTIPTNFSTKAFHKNSLTCPIKTYYYADYIGTRQKCSGKIFQVGGCGKYPWEFNGTQLEATTNILFCFLYSHHLVQKIVWMAWKIPYAGLLSFQSVLTRIRKMEYEQSDKYVDDSCIQNGCSSWNVFPNWEFHLVKIPLIKSRMDHTLGLLTGGKP